MEPYVGEIRLFAGNFAPIGWLGCDGQILSIAEYEVLYTLLGTTYGGDGQTTFALPDLRGRVPIHMGISAGANFPIGERAGTETVNLSFAELPTHSHVARCKGGENTGNKSTPGGHIWAAQASTGVYSNLDPTAAMSSAATTVAGGSMPHDNMMPYLAVRFIIATEGIFPSQQ